MRFNKRKEKPAQVSGCAGLFSGSCRFSGWIFFESGNGLSGRFVLLCPSRSGRPGILLFQVHQFLFQFVFHRRQFLFGLEPPASSFLLDAQRFFER